MRSRRIQAYSFVLVALAGLLAGCGSRDEEAIVTRRDVVAYAPLEGQVNAPASQDANILPPYKAPIGRVYVTVGQAVQEGDVIMELSEPAAETYYQQARQRVQQAEASLEQARAQYRSRVNRARTELSQARDEERSIRQRLQAAQGGAEVTVTGADLQAATARRRAAEHNLLDITAAMESGLVPYERQLAQARQAFEEAQSGRKAAMIRTPITGTVLSINARTGDVVDPEEEKPVARVVNLDALAVYAEVNDSLAERLEPGAEATITIPDAGTDEFEGTLRNVYSQQAGFLRGVEHTAVLDFRNREGQAKPGMEAEARVKLGEAKDALTVPSSAVFERDGRQVVNRRSDGEWRARVVETGISDGRYTVITSGLEEGDVVQANPQRL